MSSTGFILSNSVLDRVIDALAARRLRFRKPSRRNPEHPTFNDRVPTLPSREVLRKIVTEAFWASHLKEEARSVAFSLTLKDPRYEPAIFEFLDEKVLFDSQSLVKICPALDDARHLIGLTGQREDDLRIWGFASKSKSLFGVGSYEEEGLVFHAPEPGRVIIRLDGSVICIVEGRETIFVDSSPLSNVLAEPWIKLYQQSESMGTRREKIAGILSIVHQIRDLHHGGTLIVAPDTSEWEQSLVPGSGYTPKLDFNWITQAYERASIVKLEPGKLTWPQVVFPSAERKHLHQEFQERLLAVAKLSAVDGAVVMSPNFRVLRFGSHIEASSPQELQIVELKKDTPPYGKPIASLRGRRHQSAAQFAMNQPKCLVFVVSQDGVISLMVGGPSEQQVTVYRYLEYLRTFER